MKRFIPYALLITGILLSMSAVLVMAQDEPEVPEPSAFAGTGECQDCHRDLTRAHSETVHALTMVEIGEATTPEENPVVADFSVGEDIRTVSFPTGDETRAFTLEDVAFTLGAGRHVQAYLYEAEEGQYYVFPSQWNVTEQVWEPLALAENWPDEAYAFGQQCAGCHTVGLNEAEGYQWEEPGVMCESCHGPGLNHVEAADDAGGSIDEEERAAIYAAIHIGYDSQTCGQCHVRGLAADGIHPYPTDYYPGTVELSEVYTLPETTDDAHWWPSGHAKLPNMQFNEWLISTHPNALASAQESEGFEAACLSCHSVSPLFTDLRLNNNDIDPATIDPLAIAETMALGVTCASCHDPHTVTDSDNAEAALNPAGMLRASDRYTLCVSCHTDNDVTEGLHYPVQQVFEGFAFIEEIEVAPSPHFTAEGGADCVSCHMTDVPTYNGERSTHTFEVISPGAVVDLAELQDTCSGCHEEGPAALQQLIDDLQNSTRQRIETARAAITDETPAWVTLALDVIEADGSDGIHNYAYTDTLLDAVETALGFYEN